jgi:hypothetical protein
VSDRYLVTPHPIPAEPALEAKFHPKTAIELHTIGAVPRTERQ